MIDPNDTCASLARAVDEPLAGTAPEALGWMAVEVPGAWGRDGLTEAGGIDPEIAATLTAAAAGQPVRLQAIRRPGGGPAGGRRTVVLAHAGTIPWCEVVEVDDDGLAGLDPAVCASPTPPGLAPPHDEPVVLVCTHARRDRCCATLGRPVADTLAALHPGRVWETSHTGGHRFAANLVILPHGLVFGGLDVADAVETVALHLAGRIDVQHLRGRSGLDRPAQAAEALARAHLDLDRHGDLRVGEVVDTDHGDIDASVEARTGHRYRIRLGREPVGTLRRVSCDRDDPEDPEVFRLRAAIPEEP